MNLVLAGALLLANATETRLHKFVFRTTSPAKTVSVAGTFNDWNRENLPLKSDDGKSWSAEVRLPYGSHRYKFVIDGSTWVLDPTNPKNETDGGGNTNSVLIVAPEWFDNKASRTDSELTKEAVAHSQSIPFLVRDTDGIHVRIRLRKDDVEGVKVVTEKGSVPAALITSDDLYEWYEAILGSNTKSYRLDIDLGSKHISWGRNGFSDPELLALSSEAGVFKTPNWIESAVFYQVFPDRFENGSATNDLPGTEPWNAKPTYRTRLGGDIAGIQSKLGYLRQLGVNSLYLNPIFESPSNHRYDTDDYRKVAPDFGTNPEFDSLVKSLKANSMKVVLDFAFNHTSVNYFAFKDLREKGESSPYRSWYTVHSFPIKVQNPPNYHAWANFPAMPKLRVTEPDVQKELLDVSKFWLKRGVDGMRLDVANEVDPSLWKALRKVAKAENTNSWILGEVWTDASQWLGGDQWDSAMNYDFRTASIEFFAKQTMPPSMFASKLMANYYRYAPQVSRNLFNLLSSHDTARFLTVCNEDTCKAHLAAMVQFTWVGVPSIFYGEEIGMTGGEDPDNRRGMRWDLVVDSNPTLQLYKSLVAARRSSEALQHGKPTILSTNDDAGTFAFARSTKSDAVVTVINRSETSQEVELDFSKTELQPLVGREVIDVLSGKKHKLRATRQKFALSGKQGIILALSKDSHYPGRRSTMLVHRFAPRFQPKFGLGHARSIN